MSAINKKSITLYGVPDIYTIKNWENDELFLLEQDVIDLYNQLGSLVPKIIQERVNKRER